MVDSGSSVTITMFEGMEAIHKQYWFLVAVLVIVISRRQQQHYRVIQETEIGRLQRLCQVRKVLQVQHVIQSDD